MELSIRITPAYAGKRITMAMLVTSGKDHPRLCGEKYGARRGALMTFRITPAYAGKRDIRG